MKDIFFSYTSLLDSKPGTAASAAAWKFYEEVYPKWVADTDECKVNVAAEYELTAPVMRGGNLVAEPMPGSSVSSGSDNAELYLQGEPLFDFSDSSVRALFKRCVEGADTDDSYVEELLMCRGANDTPMNLCLFPAIPGLTSLRAGCDVAEDGTVVFDSNLSRTDTFLHVLHLYYNGEPELLMRRAGKYSAAVLAFFDLFKEEDDAYASVVNFCRDVLLIDGSYNLIKLLVIDGAKPLLNAYDVDHFCYRAIMRHEQRSAEFNNLLDL